MLLLTLFLSLSLHPLSLYQCVFKAPHMIHAEHLHSPCYLLYLFLHYPFSYNLLLLPNLFHYLPVSLSHPLFFSHPTILPSPNHKRLLFPIHRFRYDGPEHSKEEIVDFWLDLSLMQHR